jgi:hypothetical protein
LGALCWPLGTTRILCVQRPRRSEYGIDVGRPTNAFSNWRTSTLSVPESSSSVLNATDLFCSLSEWGSKATIYIGSKPWMIAAILVGILGIISFCIYRIWGYFVEALDIFGNELRTFLGIGMLAIPIGLLFNPLTVLVSEIRPMDWMLQTSNDSAGGKLTVVAIIGGAQQAAMTLVVVPAVIAMLVALLIYVVVLSFAAFSLVLIPVAVYIAVRWLFYPQSIVLDDQKPGWNGLRKS